MVGFYGTGAVDLREAFYTEGVVYFLEGTSDCFETLMGAFLVAPQESSA